MIVLSELPEHAQHLRGHVRRQAHQLGLRCLELASRCELSDVYQRHDIVTLSMNEVLVLCTSNDSNYY